MEFGLKIPTGFDNCIPMDKIKDKLITKEKKVKKKRSTYIKINTAIDRLYKSILTNESLTKEEKIELSNKVRDVKVTYDRILADKKFVKYVNEYLPDLKNN